MSQVLVTRHPERIGRLVLTNCDTHENFPPGIFKAMPPLAKLPGGMALLARPFRIGAVARAAFKPFAQEADPAGPDRLLDGARRCNDPGVKHDLKKVTVGMNKRYTLEAAEKLRGSRAADPAHLGAGRPLFPIKLRGTAGRRSRNARIVEIPDAEHLRPARPAPAAGRRDRDVRRRRLSGRKRTSVPRKFFAKCRFFVRPRGPCFCSCDAPHRGRRAMAKEIFDQDRPRSTMAQQTRRSVRRLRPVDRRRRPLSGAARSTLSPRPSSSSRMSGSAAAVRTQEPRAL